MPFKVTKAVRNAVRNALARSNQYDASTMRIARNDWVSAAFDANKTNAGSYSARTHIAHAADMVTQDGTIREGY